MEPKKALTTTDKPHAVGYVRVSTQSQAEEGESLDTQKKQIQAHAESKGWELVRIYEDAGISGSKAENRPELNELRRDARNNGGFRYLIITKLSRFTRSTRDFLALREELEKLGVTITSIAENIDPSTHTGKLMLTLLASIAEWERDVIREQMAVNKIKKLREHRTHLGKSPFGYTWDKKQEKFVINPKEAKTYKRVVKMYVDQGLSLRDIQVLLKQEGIRCKKAYFSSITLSYMLKNPCYYGYYPQNTRVYKGKLRTKEVKPAEEHVEIPIPALITKPEWDRIQKRTEFNKVKSKRTTWSADCWLRDIVYCQHCGGKMHADKGKVRKDGTFARYYCCYWASASAGNLKAASHEKCNLPYISADKLENRVWYEVLRLLRHPYHQSTSMEPALDLRQDYEEEIKNLEEELAKLEQEEKALKKVRQRQQVQYESGEFDLSEVKERLNANKQKTLEVQGMMAEIEGRRKDLCRDRDNDQAAREFIRDKGPAIERMLADMERLEPADRKRVIESVLPGPLMVYWDPEPTYRGEEDDDGQPLEDGPWEETGVSYSHERFRFNPEIFQWLLDEGKISPIGGSDPEDDPPEDPGNKGKKSDKKSSRFNKNSPLLLLH